ncbi:transporter, NhaC family [Aminomonas paucivorans DSM 12260]|uniref:Transporter, NhaC family n=1 Tax=Aminomonas paucivorans DSM 12260 TaxID=584708 RepID=E3CZR6_9BACT|nr:Na+/H+ antiporter NhaC [Aminomonas paucivorans]EFQ24698.1 transporter, NhaC family [Aminomonas paucivorans DSM 12260]
MSEQIGRKPTLAEALAVLFFSGVFIGAGVLYWEVSVHIPIVVAATLAALVGRFVLKRPWTNIEEGMIQGIMMAMQAMLILYIIGMIIGTWIPAGVVPSMISYGLSILSPSVFLLTALIICSIVSLATGSSWSTAGTVGIAFMGIGAGLGIPAPVTAGIIISGAYVGDKMSPLSDTTNLAPAVAGTDLFQHIRAMCWTTIPTYLVVCVIATVMGFRYAGGSLDGAKISAIQAILAGEFHISLLGFVPPIIVIALCVAKCPAIPGLFSGVAAGAAMALMGGYSVGDVLGFTLDGYTAALAGEIAGAPDLGAVAKVLTDHQVVGLSPALAREVGGMLDTLLTRGGMMSMANTIALITCALSFGGIMERCGFLDVVLEAIMKMVRTVGGLVTSVIVSAVLSNLFLGDQYLSLVMPGRIFKSAFEKKGLHARMLSRTLEDAGTMTSSLVPWNTCGAYMSGALGVPTAQYIPYAFLNWLNPLMAILLTYLGIGVAWRGRGGEPVLARTRPEELTHL